MNHIPADLKKTADTFLENIREAFGDNLASVALYGRALRGEKGKNIPAHFMVVVDDNTPSELARAAKYIRQWRKKNIAVPLVLTREYIESSLDTFPLEFMDMKSSYHVLSGKDVLKNLVFETDDIRAQCERELKGKLLHLRAEYMTLRGDAKGLIDLVDRSLATFRMVFAGSLYLKDAFVPETTADIIEAVTEAYGLNAGLFNKLAVVARGELKISGEEADDLFDRYVEELDKLSHAIDTFQEAAGKPQAD